MIEADTLLASQYATGERLFSQTMAKEVKKLGEQTSPFEAKMVKTDSWRQS